VAALPKWIKPKYNIIGWSDIMVVFAVFDQNSYENLLHIHQKINKTIEKINFVRIYLDENKNLTIRVDVMLNSPTYFNYYFEKPVTTINLVAHQLNYESLL
jgi:hypothetical protein